MSDVVNMDAGDIGLAAVRHALRDEFIPYLAPIKPPKKKRITWRWVFYPALAIVTTWALLDQPAKSDAALMAEACKEDPSFTVQRIAEEAVTKELWSPGTAKFRGVMDEPYQFLRGDGCSVKVVGWVDAQNRFGAVTRSTWRVEMKPILNDRREVEWKMLHAIVRDGFRN